MPFDVVETIGKHNQPPTALLSYMRPKKRGRNAGDQRDDRVKPRLSITIPTTICGRGKAERHVLLFGSGADAGKVRIRAAAANEKGVKPHEFKAAFRWTFGHVPKLGTDIWDGERHPVTSINDDEFEIVCPAELLTPAK